ncbi:hypothetical protein A3E97_03580 [Candidatus Uhrbacteria bacterium RIFCSPHIGHO2_12_FULL_47_12]|nr:MAG: hypothetical protein A2839_04550 [Candidatus Uhrbacteria bacterium RIFCSPHIGHO2_01_FULL_47_10]OGL77516.1 MAG: hypothetical protein A3E97_03580 [Candidatus Uhrbacteria bacterium RIFCSPHIGHO2_12_FULL_47_12]
MKRGVWNKIQKVLRFVLENKHSAFYREKFRPYGLDRVGNFRTMEDFFKLPLLRKDELLLCSPFERIFTDIKDIDLALNTSSTSGKDPLIVFRRLRDEASFWELLLNYRKRFRFAMILQHSSPANRLYSRDYYGRGLPVFIGNPYKLEETAAIASRLRIDFIHTHAPILLSFIPFLKRYYDTENIKFIMLGGQITTAQHSMINKEFPKAVIARLYGLAETGSIGLQCDLLIANNGISTYHISDNVFIEIIPVESGGMGEIVVTHLYLAPSLLVRYQTGDLGEILENKCACGLKSSLLRLGGRKNWDKITVGGFEINKENFLEIIKDFSAYVEEDFEAHFYQHTQRDGGIINEIRIKVISKLSKNSGITGDALQRLLEDALNDGLHISNRFPFRELIQQRIFLPIRVELVDSLSKSKSEKISSTQRLVPHF